MCGIAGIFAYRAGADPLFPQAVRRMTDHMRFRGPDGAEQWSSDDGRVVLGHRRLAIIETTSAGVQPMAHDCRNRAGGGRLWITFNGEIYNYRALREELVAQGHAFKAGSDTEVLLQMWERHGPAMLGRLRGMYTFALWDEAKRSLFLARDPFGIKPLYVADDGRTLRFASQVKTLVAGGGVDTTREPAGEVGFLMWGSVPEPFTLYRGVRSVPAGGAMLFEDGKEPRSFAGFDAGAVLREAEAAGPAPTGAARAELLRAAIDDSVRHHMVADVEVGLFLSGGFDSSLIATYAKSEGGHATRAVTLGFREYEGTTDDETGVAAKVAAATGCDHRVVWVTRSDFAAERARLEESMDQPTIDGANIYFVSKATQSTGLRVALTGLGGDEVFAGYPSYRQIPQTVARLGAFAPLAPTLGAAFRVISAPAMKALTSPKYASVLEYGTDYAGAYLLRRGLFMPWELTGLMDGDALRRGLDDLRTLPTLRRAIEGVASGNARVAALEIGFYMRNQLLRDADWAGMAHSLELRTPFVDAELFRRLAPLIAAPQPVVKSELKSLLAPGARAALEGLPKRGFQVPVREWLGGPALTGAHNRGWRAWALQVLSGFRAATGAAAA